MARYALFRALGGAMERLPERADLLIGTRVAEVAGHLHRPARARLRANLGPALFPVGGSVSEELVEHFVDRAFSSYGQYWVEGAKLPAISEPTMASRFVVSEGLEGLRAAAAQGRGVIIALPHMGSWEWGGSYLAHIGLPMTAVAEVLEPPALFEWFRVKREAIGLHIEPLNDHAFSTLLSTLRAGGVVGLLCDRDLGETGIPVTLLGQPVLMPAGPATLALRSGAALVAASCYSGPRSGHHAVVSPPLDTTRTGAFRVDVARLTQSIADELGWLIRRAPEQWHVLQPVLGQVP
jgi:phosphatidylinositol dimannoside acyltransferase